MNYTKNEVLQFVQEEDVKFIRLAFCDVFGAQKNVSIMPDELSRAFEKGVSIDGSAIRGFGDEVHSDLILHPDPSTLAILPWRPEHGRVVRMFCYITHRDGKPFECDSRTILKNSIDCAEKLGLTFEFGPEMEFYLFKTDDYGNPTDEPYDMAGYMDIAPDDKGENIRREICLTLEQMDIYPESSHHEEGPGQNEIDFKHSPAMQAAVNALTFRAAVKTVASRNGVYADFSPKPIANRPGNGFHINLSVTSKEGKDGLFSAAAGILARVSEMTLFLNPSENSYARLGKEKAPAYVSWACENRSTLIRIPASTDDKMRLELRSPDTLINPYLAFSLLISAAAEGITKDLPLPEKAEINFFTAEKEALKNYAKLPSSLKEAKEKAKSSEFVKSVLPTALIEYYLNFAK